jgi:hypothetical protein
MEGVQLNFWNSGVWLIPLILLGTVGGLAWLGRQMRLRALARLKEARSRTRALASRRRQIAAQVAGHSVANDEPYLTRMSELQIQLERIDRLIHGLDQQFVDLQASAHRLNSRKGMALIGAPFFWYQFNQQVTELSQKTASLQSAFQSAEGAAQRVEQIAWEVAEQARETHDLLEQNGRILKNLSAQNLHGAGMEGALREHESARQAMAAIPASFFQADEASLLEQADKETVVQVFTILGQERPGLEILLTQVDEWDKQLQETQAVSQRLRSQLSRLETSFDQKYSSADVPVGLDLQAEAKVFDNLKVISDSLHASLARMEVESLGVAAAEARRVLQAAENLETQVLQARHDLAALEKIMPELSQELRRLSTRFASLASSTVRPVDWGQSRASLTSLSHQLNSLQAVRQARTPERLQADWMIAQGLQKELAELSTSCQKASLQHAELAELLLLPELANWREWLDKARILAETVAGYTGENWPRQDTLATLANDLQALGMGFERLVGDDRTRPIEENELTPTLEETRRYVQAYQGQRERLQRIGSRLAEIQALEKTTNERIAHTLLLLQQAGHLVNSNSLLSGAAANEPARLKNELTAAANELHQPERGLVEKKARQAEAGIGKVILAVQGWLEKLTADIQSQNQELSRTLASLEPINSLDEPAVHQGREVLSAGPAHTGRYTGSPPSLEGLLGELKRRSDYWGRLTASRKALQDAVTPVLENYQAANANRQFARNEVQEVSNMLRESRGWPPASISLQAERQELAKLEEQWEGLKSQKLRSAQLAAQLSGLSARYQSLGERARQAAERFGQDQAQVSDLENEYNELVQLWQAQARAYQANPNTSQEINDLLGRSDRELVNIRQTYRQGTRSYNQVLQSLRTLVRNLRSFPAMIDENHSVDVYGHVKRAR